ncbi:pyruvate kinase 1, cytosolic-like [Triticum dicoccoides]|uniref:pyruvate kinase 1, cytosolic-like n=1 Tax=Triticum dicoccoides TaxID=85692 RepID=UPI00188EB746|nr:pyruvate kinase 1, cytosolic-like [Triticum dicoccoides]
MPMLFDKDKDIHIDMPMLSDKDKDVMKNGVLQTRLTSSLFLIQGMQKRQAREFLSKLVILAKTLIFAKIENVEPAVVTRVVDSMTDNLRPTRLEATDVANAVLGGSDAILLGAETLRGLYTVETISTVCRIGAEAEKVFNQDLYFKRTMKYVGEPMTHLESIASSSVRAAIKVKASVIICSPHLDRRKRVHHAVPRLKTNQLKWSFTSAFEARQSLIVRGLFPMIADPRHLAESTSTRNESVLKVTLDHCKASGVIKSHGLP